MRGFLVVLFVLLEPAWADNSALWQQFLPPRHALMRVYSGDLNGDARPDAIVLARSWDEAANPDTPRVLLLLLGDAKGHLHRVARADGVVRCAACGGVAGDPWARRDQIARVVFEKNGFSLLEFVGSGWRGWHKMRFVWRGGHVWLVECLQKTWHISHQFAPTIWQTKPNIRLEQVGFDGCGN